MAAPSWIILSAAARVSDTPLPDGLALSLKVEAPPRVSFLTLAPWVFPDDKSPLICAFDPTGLLVVFDGRSYCVLDVPAAKLSYRLPEYPDICFDNFGHPGVIADPAGGTGAFVLADFQFVFADGCGGEDQTLVRYWSRTCNWRTELEASPNQDEYEVPDKYWQFNDVVSHDGDIWWIDLNAGLVSCNVLRDSPPFRHVPLPDVDDDHRDVQLSNGKFRCVQICKPQGYDHTATFITMRTLIDADWTDPEYKLSFADIRASETFKAAGLPDKDPVFALIHPQNPDVLYFFLDDYLFAFDMRARKLIECEAHGLDTGSLAYQSFHAWELSPDYAAASSNRSRTRSRRYPRRSTDGETCGKTASPSNPGSRLGEAEQRYSCPSTGKRKPPQPAAPCVVPRHRSDVLEETSKGDYSIKNCVDLLESIEELSDQEKAQATNIMKSEVNREIFINFENPRVRLLWIKGEIAPKG